MLWTGLMAVFVASLGIETHVFEPDPSFQEPLSCAIAANMLTKMFVVPFAAADRSSQTACLVSVALCFVFPVRVV
jgi:hypothetical protein